MTDTGEWTGRVGSAWADEWRRTDRSFGELTDRLLDESAIGAFTAALDIGCGAGELSCALAVRRPGARVRGVDISAELIAVARQRGAGLANLAFEEADASRWTALPGEAPDCLISRHGVMFFPEPVAAFAHLHAQSASGGLLRFSCFRAREDNGWAAALAAAFPPQPTEADPRAPGPFAFADRDYVTDVLTESGWRDIAFEAVDYAMIAGEGESACEEAFAYFQRIGPAARALRELPEEQRPAALDRLREMIGDHYAEGSVALPAAAWIVTARSP